MPQPLLKFGKKDQVALLNKKLERKITEFKNFIYRTSHDVRGPIASIKGLIYLAKLENKSPELFSYFEKMGKMADKLDFILEHLHESSSHLLGNENCQYLNLEYQGLINKIISRIEKLKDLFDLNLEIRLGANAGKKTFINNPHLIFGLIENLLLILTSSVELKNGHVNIEFQPFDRELVIDIRNKNGDINLLVDALKIILRHQEEGFSEEAGFNNLHFNIFSNCLKATAAGIHAEMTQEDPLIRVTIPSLLISTNQKDNSNIQS